jgi:mRNA interferase MazF
MLNFAGMAKDFRGWHSLKQTIDGIHRQRPIGYKERDVWWLSVGHNVGCEEDGKNLDFSRPVLVVKKFNDAMFWGIPLTSRQKTGSFYCSFLVSGTDVTNTALLSQLRVFDTKRFIKKMGMVNKQDFNTVKTKLTDFLR